MGRLDDMRDDLLAGDIRDLLANDRRLAGCDLAVAVQGGVAHLTGTVRDDADRWLLRRLIGRVRGVHAVWDVLTSPTEGRPLVVDVGCGHTKQRDWSIGVDRYRTPAVSVLADLERGLPLADASVDQVFAVHVLEHVHALIPLMGELHRVLKPSGVLHVMVPDWRFVNAVADPTHVRFFGLQTFKSFCRPGLGIGVFWPLAASGATDSVFVDLRPVIDGGELPSDEVLARFFD